MFLRFGDWVLEQGNIAVICLRAKKDPPQPDEPYDDLVIFNKTGPSPLRLSGLLAERARAHLEAADVMFDMGAPLPADPDADHRSCGPPSVLVLHPSAAKPD